MNSNELMKASLLMYLLDYTHIYIQKVGHFR